VPVLLLASMDRPRSTNGLTSVPAARAGLSSDVGLILVVAAVGAATMVSAWPHHDPGLGIAQAAIGVVACLSVVARRSRPLAVALFTTTAAAFSPAALAPAIVGIASAAQFCRLGTYALVSAYAVMLAVIHGALYLLAHVGYLTNLILVVPAIGIGLVARAQRARTESERRRLIEDAQAAERRRIAREMHDVLAHRISMVSVHAGALEFNPDAPPEDIARAASVIRTSAHAALNELRDVISLLRNPADQADESDPLTGPQPTIADVSHLVEESRRAGMSVDLALNLKRPEVIPATTGRTVYRIVQEGLTNARKHAPGCDVDVQVAQNGSGLISVEVLTHARPGLAAPPRPAPPGSGTGLIGLAERVALAGGRLQHGPTAERGYALNATLPVPG
jgi:signal transduction histidine kinase